MCYNFIDTCKASWCTRILNIYDKNINKKNWKVVIPILLQGLYEYDCVI